MSKPFLLSNLRIEDLNSKTDHLGIIEKGEIIKDFLINSGNRFDEIKMFSLYGDWGSGKSTLMKFLEKELKSDFNTFFFEAWEFEKDENLAMSLLEFITYKSKDTSEEFFDDIIKYGGRILRGLGKSVKLNIPLFPNGPAIELDPSAFVEEVSNNKELSFFEALEKFKVNFQRFEDYITRDGLPDYNIVFIDDLDRCEPQQVLNLMSAIKLFFTYGKKTIFFCGVDKKAVEEAVKTRYGKVVKANEYLEKIFDISFSIPRNNDLLKLIDHYFDATYYSINKQNKAINYQINDFFKSLEFTNPRRVKKVLNKFQMFRDFSRLTKILDIPNIDLKDGVQRGYFDTIFVLYLIILHEFFSNDFEDFLNFDKKKDIYSKALRDINNIPNLEQILIENYSNKKFGSIFNELDLRPNSKGSTELLFYVCIAPTEVQKITPSSFHFNNFSSITIAKKHIDYLFYKYVNSQDVRNWLESSNHNITLHDTKQLVQNLL